MEENYDMFMKLPKGFREKFMQQVVSRTSPEDACRLSVVSKTFRAVADSDVVWDSFILPEQVDHLHDATKELFIADDSPSKYKSSKDLFEILTLCDAHFDQGDDDSWGSDKWSGKRWLKMSTIKITYLDTDYWKFNPWDPNLGHVVWLEIKGKTSTSKLSANTTYTAYLLFTLSKYFYYGFHIPIETSVWITEEQSINNFVYLDPRIAKSKCQYWKLRDDNLLEVELGDYFHNDGENRDLEMTAREVKSGKPKCGIRLHGMELRPKRESINLYCNSYHQAHSYAERNTERREGEISKEGEDDCEGTNLFSNLPEGFAQTFMEKVVSRTSPVDACRLSVVAKSFRSAAESDVVWESFLPSDYQQYFRRADSLLDISFASKKDLYLFLIGNPLLIDGNTKSFWLDKWSGKKCFMITPSFTQHPDVADDDEYSGTYGYWNMSHDHSTRFVKAFESIELLWFEVHGRISTSLLSSNTTYTAYLVHQTDSRYNYPTENQIPFEASVGISEDDESVKRVAYLNLKKFTSDGETDSQYAVERKDGWLEVELGEYFNKGGENKDLEMNVMEVTSGIYKSGYVIQGIEIRPKRG